jgi:hypothetical protein
VLEAGAAAAAAGEAGGVDGAVVGERGRRVSVLVAGLAEGGQHDRAGDPGVRGDVQCQPGVIVEPGEDLGVGAGGQPVVGEVRLPGLVRLLGGEAQVGGLGPFGRLGDDRAGAGEDPVDRGPRQRELVPVGQVPADGVRAGV